MGMLSEFRAFAMRGNVIDLAVGVIIGAAFGKIVDSLVNDIVMPLLSALLGGRLDFTNLFVPLGAIPPGVPATYDALKKAGVPLFAYGSFVTVLINFLLLAFVIFLLIRQVNRFGRLKGALGPEAAPAPEPTPTEAYLKEIRDLMARQARP